MSEDRGLSYNVKEEREAFGDIVRQFFVFVIFERIFKKHGKHKTEGAYGGADPKGFDKPCPSDHGIVFFVNVV